MILCQNLKLGLVALEPLTCFLFLASLSMMEDMGASGSGCCVVSSCCWGRGVVVTGAMVITGGAWLMLTPASVPATCQSH